MCVSINVVSTAMSSFLIEFKLLPEGADHFIDGNVDYGLLDALWYDDVGLLGSSSSSPKPVEYEVVFHETFQETQHTHTQCFVCVFLKG